MIDDDLDKMGPLSPFVAPGSLCGELGLGRSPISKIEKFSSFFGDFVANASLSGGVSFSLEES